MNEADKPIRTCASLRLCYKKRISLFSVVVLIYSFHLYIAALYYYVARGRNVASAFKFVLLFSGIFFQMLSVVIKEWKFLCIRFRFVLRNQ